MLETRRFVVVRHIIIGLAKDYPAAATVRLSADKSTGPHLEFVADAMALKEIASALAAAAQEIHKRAH